MIEAIKKYWAIGIVLAGLVGGLISTYALPSASFFFSFLLDVREVKGEIAKHRTDIEGLKEVVVRTDERYKFIQYELEKINKRADRQERLSRKNKESLK